MSKSSQPGAYSFVMALPPVQVTVPELTAADCLKQRHYLVSGGRSLVGAAMLAVRAIESVSPSRGLFCVVPLLPFRLRSRCHRTYTGSPTSLDACSRFLWILRFGERLGLIRMNDQCDTSVETTSLPLLRRGSCLCVGVSRSNRSPHFRCHFFAISNGAT